MIRVIIADDEVKVCQLICGLIDWKSVDMEIVGVAHNGIEALELIKNLQPDLMITDIRMPGYDGLEIIKRGKQIKKDIDFIIISGYSHFEYAQSAIKYGVSDYLLKPINKKELLNTLNKIREKYRQRTQQLSSEEQLRLRLQSDIDKLRSGLFTEILLQKGVSRANIGIDKINEDYHFKFRPACFQVLIVKIDCEYEDLYENIKVLEEKITQILRGHLKSECFDMEIYFKNSRAYCVLNYEISNQKTIRKKLRAGLDDILVQKSLFYRIEFTIGLGTAVEDINQLKESLKTAESAIGQRLVEGTAKLLDGALMQDFSSNGDILMSDLTKDIEASLEVLNSKGVLAAIDSLKVQVLNKSNILGQEIFCLVIDAYSIYLMLLRNYQFNTENVERFYETFSFRADLCSSSWELFAYLSKVIGKSLDAIIEDKKQANIKPIRTAKQYIQQNYMNPITLKDVSSLVGFNDSYFSSLFKKECGINFSEYLSEVRMNKAKDLLKETNLCIADICQTVGYNDLKHFTKSFKKFTGLKPNEYRKLYA